MKSTKESVSEGTNRRTTVTNRFSNTETVLPAETRTVEGDNP